MVKFDYANRFYQNNIFSLDDIETFKNKVIEAIEIEKHFFNLLPNVEFIREYIIYSYVFEKNLNIDDRINYIKGLVYASDYVDLDDLNCISDDINFLNNFDYEPDEIEKQNGYNFNFNKSSIWKFTSYFSMSNQNDFLDHLEESTLIEVEIHNNFGSELLNNANFKNQIKNANVNYIEMIEQEKNNNEIDNYDDGFISVEDKINLFESNTENYIQKTMLLKIELGKITNKDMPKIIAGMNRWFEFIFSSMKDIVTLENNKLDYKNENIFKFL